MRDLAGEQAAVAVFEAPAELPARLTVARKRHAEHYRSVLAADDLYLKGGEQVVLGLALFDRERRNIETGRTWRRRLQRMAVARIKADPAVAEAMLRN